MRKLLGLTLLFALAFTVDANARKRVYINKPPPVVYQPIAYPLAVVPPFAVAFDLIRRTSCDPSVAVSTGKGDPGFDIVDGPQVGNFLIPAIWNRCSTRPQPR